MRLRGGLIGIIATALVVGAAAVGLSQASAIINGKPVQASAAPSWVVVFLSTGCDGTLVGDRWVLTAHHCLAQPGNQTGIRAGSRMRIGSADRLSGGTIATARAFRVRATADLALIELTAAVPNKPLPPAPSRPAAGTMLHLYGWGLTCSPGQAGCQAQRPRLLNEATMPVAAQGACGGNEAGYICVTATRTNAMCFGDSGGPLEANGQLVGVVSHERSRQGANVAPICGLNNQMVGDVSAATARIVEIMGAAPGTPVLPGPTARPGTSASATAPTVSAPTATGSSSSAPTDAAGPTGPTGSTASTPDPAVPAPDEPDEPDEENAG